MPKTYKIPLSDKPQRFSITLGGVDLRMTLAYRNVEQGGWTLDIADAQGSPLISGIPLVCGADLLAQHASVGIPGRLYWQGAPDPDQPPSFEGIASEGALFWVTD